eukprot:CAMPEP_0184973834 /NCGR_PEP_ID=MMETSP1098-20130426/5467_1 /TAXON_ID=89044 /ORGANISM="Spumella elongata, Strain CCAP 955/1" /LENGTH=519 /DNA_ID=CAMNT_0027496331 /DNA_START=85 /DNA_END=1644 /DNA_ORIENTATION=-
MEEMKLVKIGPGLGKRSKLWAIVKKKMKSKDKFAPNEKEQASLDNLAVDKDWMDLVPAEWQATYGELFDTACCREPIRQKTKEAIARDVPRTFSLYIEHARYLRLQFTEDMSSYCAALQGVLELACHQSYSCGYCQGMNFLAATFLLSEADCRSAFILLTYLLRHCHLEILYNPRCSSLLEYMMYFEKRLETHNPTVFKHLQNEEFPPLCYSIEWFTTCFLVSSPGELSACVLDLMLSGFEDIMIRVGLALMDHLESVILQSNAEKLQLNFKRMLLLANSVDVMYRALQIPSENIDGMSRLETMKSNTEKMDPNAEWVDTMKTCAIHAPTESIPTAADSSCTCMPGETSTNGAVTEPSKNGEPKHHHSQSQDHSHDHSHHHHHSHTHTHSRDPEHKSSQQQKGHQQHYLETRVTPTHRASHAAHSSTTATANFKSPHKDPAKHTATRKSYSSPPGIPYNSSEDPEFADWNHRSVSASAVIGPVETHVGVNSMNGNSEVSKPSISRTLSEVNVVSLNTAR